MVREVNIVKKIMNSAFGMMSLKGQHLGIKKKSSASKTGLEISSVSLQIIGGS